MVYSYPMGLGWRFRRTFMHAGSQTDIIPVLAEINGFYVAKPAKS
ncbi:MAG: hypothetical protein OSA98_08830 [Rubripirellula sp.]|nr:hypothetical protein [Rubripirellula sp.]